MPTIWWRRASLPAISWTPDAESGVTPRFEGSRPLIVSQIRTLPSAKQLPGRVSGFIRGYTGINDANSVVLVQSSPRQPVEGHTRDTEQFPC